MNKSFVFATFRKHFLVGMSLLSFGVFAQQAENSSEKNREVEKLERPAERGESPFDAVQGLREDKSKRDAYSKHYINTKGGYTALIGAGPIHYEKNGQFLDIEYFIYPNTDGIFTYANKANLMESHFASSAHHGVKNVTPEGALVEFLNTKMFWLVNGQVQGLQNSANVPLTVNNDKAYYNNLYGSISAEFTIEAGRRKLNYIIPNVQALGTVPQGASYLTFSEDIVLPNGWAHTVEEMSGIVIFDSQGKRVFGYKKPFSFDASMQMDLNENTIYETAQNGNVLTILTKVSITWLTDSNRQFPIYVDPTVNAYPNGTNYNTGQVGSGGAGAFGTIAVGYNNGFYRGFATFGTQTIPVGSTINSTSLYHNVGATTGMGTARGSELRAFLAVPGVDYTTVNAIYNAITNVTVSPLIYQTVYNIGTTGWKNITLGAQANNHLSNRLGTHNNFTVGYRPAGDYSGAAQVAQLYGWPDPGGLGREPYIVVDYTPQGTCFGGTASGPAWVQTNNTANLTLSGHTGSNIQWQSSPNGTTGWTNVSTGTGGTTTNYTTAALANGTYYFRVEVSEGACTEYSNVVTINVSANPVYCSGAGSGNATLNNHIQSIGFHEWVDPTVGGTNNYVASNYLDYTDTTTYGYATVVAGQYHHLNALIRAQGTGTNSTTFAYWIDWNGDGVFTNTAFTSNGERLDNVNYTSAAGNSYAGYFTVPASANGMVRVRMRAARGNIGILDPCTAYTQSQTKDFMVKVLPNMGSQACNVVNGNANVVLTNNTVDKVNITRVKVDGPGGNVLDNQGQFFGVQVGATVIMYNYSNFMGSYSNGLVLEAGQSYSVEIEHSGYTTACGLFIDWNNDGAFAAPNDFVQVISDPNANPFTFNFTVPASVTDGQEIIFRVRLQYEGSQGQAGAMTACNNMTLSGLNIYSEVEDYRATLSAPPLVCAPVSNLTAEIGNPMNGLNHHLSVSWDALSGATAYEFEYSTDASLWQSEPVQSATIFDFNAGDNPNAPYYFRVRATDGIQTCDWSQFGPIYTAADVPATLIYNNVTSTSFEIEIPAETPVANPSYTTYSLFNPALNLYVQANGTLGATEVFQTIAAWDNIALTGLTPETEYCFVAKAKNEDGHIVGGEANTLLATQPFDASSSLATNSSAPTNQFWSPATCATGGLVWNASNGCTAGAVGFSGAWNNFFGCFLRTPIVNASGTDEVELKFNLSNSYFAGNPNDRMRIYFWADAAYNGNSITSLKIDGVESLTNFGGNGQGIAFNQQRTCAEVVVKFNIAAVTNKSSIQFYFEPDCQYNNSNIFYTWIDNVTFQESIESITSCVTTLEDCANPSIAPTTINSTQEMCFGGSTTLSINDGTLAAGAQWEWFEATCGSTPIGTGTSISVSPSATTSYFVRASEGTTCPASACTSIEVELPTISNNLALNGETATCYVNHNNWVHFYNDAGNLLASINSAGQDLGNVTMTAIVAGEPYQKPSCDSLSSPAFTQTVMGRSFVITPQNQPTIPVQVRLYINDAEFTAYQNHAAANDNPNDGAANLGAMNLSKVSGGASSGNPMDLCDETNATVQYIEQNVGGSGSLAGLSNFGSFANVSYLEFTVTGFSEFFLMNNSDNSALPVSLTAFSATCDDDKIQVSWTTASELNASHYILQSSRDGQTWLHLAEIEAAGTTNQTSNYSYTDQNFGTVTYYRLVQVDIDGEQAVYGPISSNCNLVNNLMTVHPNPASESFMVTLQSTETIENAQVDLVDMSGRVVMSQTTDINAGSTMMNFEVKEIQPGAYIIRVQGENDKFTPIRVVKL